MEFWGTWSHLGSEDVIVYKNEDLDVDVGINSYK